jgi:hypothetical protein
MIKKDTHTEGLTCITHANKVLLKWKQCTQTIHLGTNNVPILQSGPDFNDYLSHSSQEIQSPKALQAFIKPTNKMLQDMLT